LIFVREFPAFNCEIPTVQITIIYSSYYTLSPLNKQLRNSENQTNKQSFFTLPIYTFANLQNYF